MGDIRSIRFPLLLDPLDKVLSEGVQFGGIALIKTVEAYTKNIRSNKEHYGVCTLKRLPFSTDGCYIHGVEEPR